MPRQYATTPEPTIAGTAYNWILEQMVAYPGSYEIPLRTMYTLNSAPSAKQQPPTSSHRANTPSLSSSSSSVDGSPQTPDFPPEPTNQLRPGTSTDHFKQCLMEHISSLPSQPFSLPPAFITHFVRRCFTEDLCMVDFTQALTAMDYLKDMDSRRRRELASALQRLGLDRGFDERHSDQSGQRERMVEWIQSMQDKERKVEALYTQVYIGLRRWTLINEMRLDPFSKSNSVAMLNTLYPPATTLAPTRQLTPAILLSQRNAFFRYITGVESNGKGILKNLENQGQRPGDSNGWSVVREIVDKYLRTANGLIEECADVTGPDYFSVQAECYRRDERRADSGVSFATGDRPSTSESDHSGSNDSSLNRPLPPSPPQLLRSNPAPVVVKKKGTTLEKIARELKFLRSRSDVKELPPKPLWTNAERDARPSISLGRKESTKNLRGLRKMKSTSSIGSRDRSAGGRSPTNHSRSGSSEDSSISEDLDARRKKMILEARREKERQKLAQSPDRLGGAHAALSKSGIGCRSFEVAAR